MNFSLGFAGQLARPSGLAGELVGKVMDFANRRPTRLAIDLLRPMEGERILDAGCGTGSAMAEVLRRAPCQLTGVDISATMLAAAAAKLGAAATLCRAEMPDLPFPDEAFDAVLALNVLYFCDPDGQMVVNLRRVLRPGGRLIVYVTHRETMNNWRFAHQGLHRLFDEASLADLLVAGGFDRASLAIHSVAIASGVKGLLTYAER
ncbi:methyltransferase type 11 [Croceicoccus estronivorus]|uniref:class I SAM-dependent methyltransferase n=1 Tax=Croceicoccus estronivorus TaxID=1172626 RepID=UPI00082ED44E|nr:class I SAM-dependent methyltransferase [Croceicoccus estronivorus]OCC25560.1 methyltransferase type 11 [Croceicoccus estronivorus]